MKEDRIGVLFLVCIIAGVLNVCISMSLISASLSVSGARASVVAVIFSSNPIFVSFFDKLHGNMELIMSPLLALVSAVVYGIYTILGKKSVQIFLLGLF